MMVLFLTALIQFLQYVGLQNRPLNSRVIQNAGFNHL